MKLLLSIGALLLALPIQQTRTPPPLTAEECKCSIEVTVKRQSNGDLISEATVTARFNPPRPANAPATAAAQVVLTAMTDNAGRAVFSNLAEGSYLITVQREGYFGPLSTGTSTNRVTATASIGPASNNVESAIQDLASSGTSRPGQSSAGNLVRQRVQHVVIDMIQGGVISGRIEDASHKPASGIVVRPFQVTYPSGQRTLSVVSAALSVLTDDFGQFRSFWFPPGEYYLRIELQPSKAGSGGGPNFPSPTYYPGTMDLAQARPIVIHEGQEVNGTDFALQKSIGVTISGTVTNNILPEQTAANVPSRADLSFFLVPRNANTFGPPQAIPNAAQTTASGGAAESSTSFPFEIRGVPAGSYDFYAIVNSGTFLRPKDNAGHVAIDAGTQNISGIKAAIQTGVDLKVHFSIADTLESANNQPERSVMPLNIRMQIRPVDNVPSPLINQLSQSPITDNDGIITISNVPEGKFFISTLSGLPADGYVSDIHQGSRNIKEDRIINIGKDAADPLEIIISRNRGWIAGTLEDRQHNPEPGVKVFLIPDVPQRNNFLLYRSVTSFTKGEFSFHSIVPGSYKLFAWSSIPDGAEQNEEFIHQYEALGTRVLVIEETPTPEIQVQVIPVNR